MARAKRLTKDERREQLLEAALAAFGRGGYHGTQVEDVIAEAGVARGTFYLHFPSKHAVFEALVERMLAVLHEVAPRGGEEDYASAAAWEDFLRRSYGSVLETLRRYRRLGRLLFDEAEGLGKGFAERIERSRRRWTRRFAGAFEVLRRNGVAREDLDAEIAAELVLGMIERLARRYLFRDGGPSLDRVLEALVAFEVGAIAGRVRG